MALFGKSIDQLIVSNKLRAPTEVPPEKWSASSVPAVSNCAANPDDAVMANAVAKVPRQNRIGNFIDIFLRC